MSVKITFKRRPNGELPSIEVPVAELLGIDDAEAADFAEEREWDIAGWVLWFVERALQLMGQTSASATFKRATFITDIGPVYRHWKQGREEHAEEEREIAQQKLSRR